MRKRVKKKIGKRIKRDAVDFSVALAHMRMAVSCALSLARANAIISGELIWTYKAIVLAGESLRAAAELPEIYRELVLPAKEKTWQEYFRDKRGVRV